MAVSLKAFEEQVADCSRHFSNVSMDALVDYIHQPPLSFQCCSVIFYDGYAHNFKAGEVLR